MKDSIPDAKRQLFFELFQPGTITLTIGSFCIGIGVAYHLGGTIKWVAGLFLLAAFLFLLWARNFLNAYWDHPNSPLCFLKSTLHRFTELNSTQRNSLLTYALFCLTGAAVCFMLAMEAYRFSLVLGILILLVFILMMVTSLPPFLLNRKGYAELIEAFIVFILVPAAVMILNYGELNPLLELLTVPIFFVFLAGKLVFSLRTYSEDKMGGYPNLLNRLDWERAMKLHNSLILVTYVLVAVFSAIGLPWHFTWPLLLTLPIAAFELILVVGIIRGGKPNWRILEWTSGSLVGSMCYLVLLTLWLH